MPNLARRTIALAALAVAIIATAVALDLSSAQAQNEDEQTGRIVARRLDDGRTEFGWQPTGGERVLPRLRYFPANVEHNRWLNSSPIEVDGEEIGRINARQSEDGRIEFAFTPTDRERILPPSRYFPNAARVNRWLRSTEIMISAAPATGFVAISAGYVHACAIRAGSREIECWGDNYAGELDAPPGRFAAVRASSSYTCAIRESREIECWGARDSRGSVVVDFGQLDAPPGPFRAVAPGVEHACGLRESGEIECWGTPFSDYGQTAAPTGRFIAVFPGGYRTCGLRVSGEIECWGRDDFVVGTAPPDDPYISIVADDFCGLRKSGATDCVTRDARPGPFSAVSAGWGHACAIRVGSGEIECWGSNSIRVWNEETETAEEVYTGQLDAPTGRFSAVAVGGGYSCAIRENGEIECWGNNEYGQTEAPAP